MNQVAAVLFWELSSENLAEILIMFYGQKGFSAFNDRVESIKSQDRKVLLFFFSSY